MARTGITNICGNFIMLPPPYTGGLGPGQQAVVSDSQAVVIAALGGAVFIQNDLLIVALPNTAALTAHNNAIGTPRMFETTGTSGAFGVGFSGAKVGDKVIDVSGSATGGDLSSSFESNVSVANQVQQSTSNDLSAVRLLFTLLAKS